MIMREFPIIEKAAFNVWRLAGDILSFYILHFTRYILQDMNFLLPTLQNAMNSEEEIISKVNIIPRTVR